MIKRTLALLFVIGLATSAQAATYYVSPWDLGGRDSAACSSVAPCHSSTKTVALMVAGDTMVWKNGVYANKDIASRIQATGLVGTSTAPYTFQGETFGEVIFTSGPAMNLTSSSWVKIDKTVIKNSTDGSAMVFTDVTSSTYCNFIIKNGSPWNDRYASPIQFVGTTGNGTKYCLAEKGAIIGAFRYGQIIGGGDGFSEFNIVRLVVTRFDGSDTVEPIAGISNYGETTGIDGARNNLVQNCIGLDYNGSASAPNSDVYAAFYNPQAATNIRHYGIIALNVPARGLAIQDTSAGASGNHVYNSVFVDTGLEGGKSAIGAGSSTDQDSNAERVTIRGTTSGTAVAHYGTGEIIPTNSLFISNPNGSGGTGSYNHYWNTTAAGTNSTEGALANYSCIVKVPDGTAADGSGSDGGDRGATVMKRYGVEGTIWGQTGYDTLTDVDHLPWPNDELIRTWAALPDEGAWATGMSGNDEDRGFAAAGVGITNYINDYISADGCGFDALTGGGGATLPTRGFGIGGGKIPGGIGGSFR